MSFANLAPGSTRGRPTLYQGDNPGTENKNDNRGLVGNASYSGGGGGFPFGSMNPSRVVNQTLGFQSNHTINYAYVIRRFRSGFDKALNKGQFVFMRKTQTPGAHNMRMYTLLNMPHMNYYAALMTKNKVKEKGGKEGDIALKTGLRAARDQILREWVPHGVIQGEVGGPEQDLPQERLLNLTVAGRISALNLFGRQCPDGTPLYIVLYLKDTNVGGANDEGSMTFGLASGGGNTTVNGLPRYVWQFEAYANEEDPHPADAKNTNGKKWPKHSGLTNAAFYVGRVSHNSRFVRTQGNLVSEAHTSVEKHVTLPKVEFFMD